MSVLEKLARQLESDASLYESFRDWNALACNGRGSKEGFLALTLRIPAIANGKEIFAPTVAKPLSSAEAFTYWSRTNAVTAADALSITGVDYVIRMHETGNSATWRQWKDERIAYKGRHDELRARKREMILADELSQLSIVAEQSNPLVGSW